MEMESIPMRVPLCPLHKFYWSTVSKLFWLLMLAKLYTMEGSADHRGKYRLFAHEWTQHARLGPSRGAKIHSPPPHKATTTFGGAASTVSVRINGPRAIYDNNERIKAHPFNAKEKRDMAAPSASAAASSDFVTPPSASATQSSASVTQLSASAAEYYFPWQSLMVFSFITWMLDGC
jgi:hypothetical protein